MPPVTLECPVNLEKYTEGQWQQAVIQSAGHYGWMVEHIRNMIGNKKGIPDLLMFRGDQYRLIELKTMKKGSELSAAQLRWHQNAHWFGVFVYVLRPNPDDWARMLELLA